MVYDLNTTKHWWKGTASGKGCSTTTTTGNANNDKTISFL